MARAEGKPDEEFGLELLSDHLTMSGRSGFQCAVHAEDPPDLVVNWNDGALKLPHFCGQFTAFESSHI